MQINIPKRLIGFANGVGVVVGFLTAMFVVGLLLGAILHHGDGDHRNQAQCDTAVAHATAPTGAEAGGAAQAPSISVEPCHGTAKKPPGGA
ncbi:hypothetical protein [Burkholderia gladioli]|uniref:hypothetical protein n=1 Tax=Burkholderia gladioli TaxID=28095 RepID=UPI0011B27609|nr:hypothetical protein [Burkholderia gladioli]